MTPCFILVIYTYEPICKTFNLNYAYATVPSIKISFWTKKPKNCKNQAYLKMSEKLFLITLTLYFIGKGDEKELLVLTYIDLCIHVYKIITLCISTNIWQWYILFYMVQPILTPKKIKVTSVLHLVPLSLLYNQKCMHITWVLRFIS